MSMDKIGYLSKAITYATTTSTSIGYLPPNAYITDIKVLVATAFDAGSTDYVDIGDSSTANRYANDVDVSSTGSATVTSTAYWGYVESTTDPTEIKVIYVPSGSSPTAGAAKVVIEYAYND